MHSRFSLVSTGLFFALLISGTYAGGGLAQTKEVVKAPVAADSKEEFVLDADHTGIVFEIPHLVISSVEGRFKKFTGGFTLNEKALKEKKSDALSVNAKIEVASIDTGVAKRDDHLRSPDFFNVKKFPSMSFVSKSITYGSGNKFQLNGDLTIKDQTKPVVLDVDYKGSVSAYDKKRAAFKATTTFNRKDFGLGWNDLVEAGPVVGDEVTVTLTVQGLRKSDL